MMMMKQSLNASLLLRRLATAARTPAMKQPAYLSKRKKLSLEEILALGSRGANIADMLTRYANHAPRIDKLELLNWMLELRTNKRYHQCLRIFVWMDKKKYEFNSEECALRLDAIWKARGIAEAEEYFESLPVEKVDAHTCAALLRCYSSKTQVDQAASLFEEMKRFNYLTSAAFNHMMKLSFKFGDPEEVLGLAEEMCTRNIPFNSDTHKFFIQSCKKLDNIQDAKRFVDAIEKDGHDCDWITYRTVAQMCIRAGDFESAEAALKKLEEKNQNNNMGAYGALLQCYCKRKLVDEAAAFFEEMKRLNYATTFSFNSMMLLALKTGEPEKVPGLVEEMKRKNVPLDSFTYGLLAESCKRRNDVEGVEKTIEENEKDGEMCHWSTYSKAAATYIRAGDFEKAEKTLKKLEESSKSLGGTGSEPLHYHDLIIHYAGIGNLAAVNRVWDSLKSDFPVMSNSSYLVMLSILLKLDQLDQLQRCFDEWRLGCRRLDLNIVSVLIDSYLRQNRTVEAEHVFDEAVMETGSPFLRGRESFIAHFLRQRRGHSALTHLRAAVDVAVEKQDTRCLDTKRISEFWKYFEEEKDVDGAEEFGELLKRVTWVDSAAYLSLLRTYVAAGRRAPKMRKRMKRDGVEITRAHQVLLEKVCLE